MKLKTVTAKTAIADPRRNPDISLIAQSVILALQGVLHLSAIPWKGIGELRESMGELKRCRKEAMTGTCAFLEDSPVAPVPAGEKDPVE